MASLALGACASAGDYPTLAVRDTERVSGTFEPAPAAYIPPPAPAEALGRLDSLVAEADAAHRAFIAQAPAIRPAVLTGSGAKAGSDAWARAHIALAELQSTRAPAVIALAELDRIFTSVLTDAAQIEEIAEARETVFAMVQSEDRLIAELSGELPQ